MNKRKKNKKQKKRAILEPRKMCFSIYYYKRGENHENGYGRIHCRCIPENFQRM